MTQGLLSAGRPGAHRAPRHRSPQSATCSPTAYFPSDWQCMGCCPRAAAWHAWAGWRVALLAVAERWRQRLAKSADSPDDRPPGMQGWGFGLWRCPRGEPSGHTAIAGAGRRLLARGGLGLGVMHGPGSQLWPKPWPGLLPAAAPLHVLLPCCALFILCGALPRGGGPPLPRRYDDEGVW